MEETRPQDPHFRAGPGGIYSPIRRFGQSNRSEDGSGSHAGRGAAPPEDPEAVGAHYTAEAALKLLVPMGDFDCLVEGRADGIFTEDGEIYIDEIKGMYRDVMLLEEPVPVHLAQALCYAWHLYETAGSAPDRRPDDLWQPGDRGTEVFSLRA